MSEFHVTVVRLGSLVPHPNADTLNITKVFDYQVITKKDGFKEGDLVVYVPIDSVVPDTDDWYFLCPRDQDGNPKFPVGQVPEKYRVIEAKKLRGIFSQGMLAPLPLNCIFAHEGADVTVAMGITKYEPPAELITGGECEEAPKGWIFSTYTDIEGLRRYPNVILPDEEVVITEKIHGANARYVHDGQRVWVGSHNQIKRYDPKNLWWNVPVVDVLGDAITAGVAPFLIFFGEVYGQVQDLKYDVKSGARFLCFDVYDAKRLRYLDHDEAVAIAASLGIDWVPILYRGKWNTDLNELCEGQSTIATNVREGFVVKPVRERWDQSVGRVILKRHGEGYLLRKKK